jgi:hypothetical protein
VLISTAAGNDGVSWPGDPLFDWLFKGWYLAWMAVLSVLPAFLIVTIAKVPPSDPVWGIALAGSACFLFPIFLLSSMSGASRMFLLRGQILGGMGRRFGLVLAFYFLTAVILVGCTAFVWYALVKADLWVVPFAMISLAVGILVYARLLGRLGHAITYDPTPMKSAKENRSRDARGKASEDPWGLPAIPLPHDENPKPSPVPKKKKKRIKKTSSNVVDPWAIPEPEPIARPRRRAPAADDPLGPAEGGYELKSAERKPVPLTRQEQPDLVNDESEAFDMVQADLPAPVKPSPAPALAQVSMYEETLAASRYKAVLPSNPLMSGVFSFPFYPTSLGPLLTIALGLVFMGMIARAQIALFPS